MYRPYNAKVLIGNWHEDRALEEDVIKDYIERRANGELLSQKLANNQDNLPVTLTTVNDFRVHIGDKIMIKCDGNLNQPNDLLPKARRSDCYLLGSDQSIFGTSNSNINPNSVFIIKSVDGTPTGTAIRYGQQFAITTFDQKYFLHSDIISVDRAAKKSRLQQVDLTSVYNHECDWTVACLNPNFRLESEGSPVQANQKVILLHAKTNKALAVCTDYNRSSSFEIVANTFLNPHKVEEDVNHWKFVTNLPTVAAPDPNIR